MSSSTPIGLSGKAAIVTGAGRGIGLAIARRFASAGASVALASRSAPQLREAVREIEGSGGKAIALPTDVSDAGAVACMVDAAVRDLGRIDILVNNAGVAAVASIADMSPADFDALIATIIRGTHLCTRAVWPHLVAAGGGVIINISSMAAFDPFPGLGIYGAAKSFVNAYTKGAATEGAPNNIRVYAIAPGAVDTEMLRGAFPDFPKEQCLSPDDIAALAAELVSPACRYTRGETIPIQKN